MTDYDRMQAVLQKVHVLAGQGQPLPPDLLTEWRDLNARQGAALGTCPTCGGPMEVYTAPGESGEGCTNSYRCPRCGA